MVTICQPRRSGVLATSCALELRTLEYYYDGAVHYDNPRFIPPKARITLEGPGGRATYDCARPTIERDTVFVLSQDVGFT